MTGCSLCGSHANGQHPPDPTSHAREAPRYRRRDAPTFSQLVTDTFSIIGFDDRVTDYTARLHSVDFDGGTVAVQAEIERFGNSAIIDDGGWLLFVNGEIVDNVNAVHGTTALSGPASPGDHVVVEFTTDQFGGHTATLDAGAMGSADPVNGGQSRWGKALLVGGLAVAGYAYTR